MEIIKLLLDSISSFYKRFILLDLLSYAAPGGVALGTLIFILDKQIILKNYFLKSPFLILFILYILSFIVGIALKSFGYRSKILKYFKNDKKYEQYNNFKELQKFYINFSKKNDDTCNDDIRDWNERYMILKQMAGNFSIAFLFSGILLFIRFIYFFCKINKGLNLPVNTFVLLILCIILFFSLLFEHKYLVKAWVDWRKAALDKDSNQPRD